MVKTLEFFSKTMASALEVKHFLFWSNLIHSLACLQRTMQKVLFDCFFYVSIYHLFDIGEKSGKSLKFWIQKSVQTLKWYGFYLPREQYGCLKVL